jgi:putative PIN family toxin of toxin-antitoxin system
MRVVIDTNIFFSALRAEPKPGPMSATNVLLLRAGLGHFTLVMSEAILIELEGVLSRKLDWQQSRLTSTISRLKSISEMVVPGIPITACSDPDDNRILEAAVEGQVDFIVSGDKHLLGMKTFRGIEISTVHDFLLRLDAQRLNP